MSEQASTESTTTATAAPYGDPVTAQPAEVSNTPQVNDTTGTALETIQQKLDSFLAAVGTGKQQGEPTDDVDAQKEASPTRPEGGLNDITADELGDPEVARFVRLLDTHYPNIDRERVLGRAIEFGDPSYIDTGYLRDVAGDHADILEGYFTDVVERYGNAVETTVKEIYEAAGGEQQWGAIRDTFTRHAPESVKSIVRQLIDSKDPAEVKQGLEFIFDYSAKVGLVDTPAKRVGTSGNAGAGLSAEQFRAEVRKLGGRNRDPRGYDKAVEALKQRRTLGIEIGL